MKPNLCVSESIFSPNISARCLLLPHRFWCDDIHLLVCLHFRVHLINIDDDPILKEFCIASITNYQYEFMNECWMCDSVLEKQMKVAQQVDSEWILIGSKAIIFFTAEFFYRFPGKAYFFIRITFNKTHRWAEFCLLLLWKQYFPLLIDWSDQIPSGTGFYVATNQKLSITLVTATKIFK